MMNPLPRTVLVTGCNGFIGRHVARHYASLGSRVVGIGRGNGSELAACGVSQWHGGDISRTALSSLGERPDIVIHCAGGSSVGSSFSDPENDVRRNVGAAEAVLEFASDIPTPPSIVMLSSAAVYGAVNTLPIVEDTGLQPISPYGEGKVGIEKLSGRFAAQGIPIAVVRFFSVYGPGLRKQLFWDACKKFAQQDSEFNGTGEERRDWIHVDDAVRLIAAAATHASSAMPIVNGGSGASLTLRDALGRLRTAWSDAVPPLRFTGIARVGDPPGYEADITKAAALGWNPARSI